MPEKFLINGGKPLKGNIEARGAKNAAFPLLAATLLTKEPCRISNLPLIEDIFKMLRILEQMGAQIKWLDKREIEIKCADVDPSLIPYEVVSYFRGSILLLGPLLARFGKIKFPPPGGCLIGARPIDTHLDAFLQCGAKICGKNKFYHFEGKLRPAEVILNEFSVTATENVLLASSLLPGDTTLKIADQDYAIQELAKVLRKMGVKISGFGTHTIKISGKKKLKGFRHSVIYDPVEAGTFLVAALATNGKILIKNTELRFLELFLKRLKDFGAKFEIRGAKSILVLPSNRLTMDKVQSLPYPGIPTDLQPELGVLATQAKGPTLIHDPLYEGRLKYLEELNKMGASIIFCDPHRAIVNGPTPLFGTEIPSLDIRSGAALIIAGLVAKGKTTINNIYQIDRGYEKIEERFQNLGADIGRVNS
jgi:UDP-N-acetylglucosamine 1-carboxyvinyltransferase